MSNSIIFDVDTQIDLCRKKLNVEPSTITNIENVLIEALRNEVVILSSVVAHENNLYGYCTVGTIGQEKINETMMVEPEFYYNVANTRNGIDMNVAEECWQIVFEKQVSDIWDPLMGQPDNVQSFLRHENIDTVYIVGNNFDSAIVNAIEGFIDRDYRVKVVVDAIHWVAEETPLYHGAIPISTEQFIKEINEGDDD